MLDLPVPTNRPGEQPRSSQSSRFKWTSALTGRSYSTPSKSSQRGDFLCVTAQMAMIIPLEASPTKAVLSLKIKKVQGQELPYEKWRPY